MANPTSLPATPAWVSNRYPKADPVAVPPGAQWLTESVVICMRKIVKRGGLVSAGRRRRVSCAYESRAPASSANPARSRSGFTSASRWTTFRGPASWGTTRYSISSARTRSRPIPQIGDGRSPRRRERFPRGSPRGGAPLSSLMGAASSGSSDCPAPSGSSDALDGTLKAAEDRSSGNSSGCLGAVARPPALLRVKRWSSPHIRSVSGPGSVNVAAESRLPTYSGASPAIRRSPISPGGPPSASAS